MTDECVDQVPPSFRPRVRRVAVPPEDAVFGGLEHLRCEAELDERPDVPRQQRVVQFVDPTPIVDRLAADDLHGPEDVVEDRVKADVTETELVDGGLELGLSFRTHQRAGIVGADREVEEAVDGLRCLGNIERNLARRRSCRCHRGTGKRDSRDEG